MNFKKILLLIGDIAVFYLALALTLIIRYQELPPTLERINLHLAPFSIVLALWLIVFLITNLYSLSFSRASLEFISTWFSASAINLGIAFTFFYIVPTGIRPRANMFLLAFSFFILQYLWRRFFLHLVSREAFQKNTLFVGSSPEALEIARFVADKPQLGYRVVGFYERQQQIRHCEEIIVPPDNYPDEAISGYARANEIATRRSDARNNKSAEFKIFPESEPLPSILEREHIRCVVLSDGDHDPRIVKDVFSALSKSVALFTLADFTELLTGKIPVTVIGEMWFLEKLSRKNMFWYESIKRVSDIGLALLAAIPSLITSPFIALVIKLTDHGSVFFRQVRTGRLGKPFHAIKFRSMRVDAERNGPQWATKDDPRVTRFGKFMRATRLDEIPQLWNVLKGDLSFVGPRPERPEFVEQLKKVVPFYNERHLVKPGLTGWDQISGKYHSASPKDTLEKLQYDLYYIKNRSLWLDVIILLKTVKTILTGGGR